MAGHKRKVTGGWVGRILRVDLTSGRTEEQAVSDYVPDYVGGRGIAARIAWDELRPETTAFSPDNLLMFFTGPLTGTTAACSGRVEVCGRGPQGYPHEWFTRSGMGGRWGPELKYAGYDGLVIEGCADRPVYLWISDGKAEIKDASHLWGLGTYETQQRLMAELGREVRVAAIGQAGENLSRIGVINTETESAAGQGGFGGVMGSKKLKAIAVKGTGSIRVANPEEFQRKTLAIARECHGPFWAAQQAASRSGAQPKRYGERPWACSQQCPAPCAVHYRDVPGVAYKDRRYSGQMHCVAGLFQGMGKNHFYSWSVGFEGGFEASSLANDYGLNHWDLLLGVFPWLQAVHEAGLLKDLDGMPIDLNNPAFWAETLRKMAFREGAGEPLADGGWRAHLSFGFGAEEARPLFAAWGYTGHWDGHGDRINRSVFPYWIVAGLQWAMDTRDPISSGHGFAEKVIYWSGLNYHEHGLPWDKMIQVGERIYGNRAVDPLSGYEGKAVVAHWHTIRSVLKDSVPADDFMYPRMFSHKTEDGFARAEEMEGPSFEFHMFKEATGVDWSAAELDRACERIMNLDRAIQIRDFGRSRTDDECVIPYLEAPENLVNPFIGEKQSLDGQKFRELMDELYRLRGWDVETGWPTPSKLRDLGLSNVAAVLAGLSTQRS